MLNKIIKNNVPLAANNSNKTQVILCDVPFVGRPSSAFGKKLINISKQIKPNIQLQPIPRPFPKLQSFFARKDPLPKESLSHVVYNVHCNSCPANNIGKTTRKIS